MNSTQRERVTPTLHCEIAGHGAALVLVHGWAVNRTVFRALSERLAQRFQVYLVDLPGHGASGSGACEASAEAIARAVAAHVPDDAIWLGWSLGGVIALAATQFATLRGLVMVASSPRLVRSDG